MFYTLPSRFLSIITFVATSSLFAASEYQEEFLEQLMLAEPYDVIEIPAGTFEFDTQMSLAVDHITIKGQGAEKTILSFKDQSEGAEGLSIAANHVTLEGFTIQDTKGDGIKISGSEGVVIRGLRVLWSVGPQTLNGGYGLYPVQSKDILIEGSYVSGASDAGIYVGQSQNVVLRRNHVEWNVAGIEVENSVDVDVYGNYVTKNTGGILIFNLPELGNSGQRTRVFGNTIIENNLLNFAPAANTVADVPTGTGVMITANKKVEIYENYIAHHQTANVILASYAITGRPIQDPTYNPQIADIYIYDNTFVGGGYNPKGGSSQQTKKLIRQLRTAIGLPFPDILYDGLSQLNPQQEPSLCIQSNFDLSFLDLDLGNDMAHISSDLEPYACSLPRLPGSSLPSFGGL